MRFFWGAFLLGCFLVAAFNFGVDPAGRWHRAPRLEGSQLMAGQAWVLPRHDVNERLLKVSHLSGISKPDIVAFGSSRVMMLESRMFRDGFSFFNAGVSGGAVEDYIAFWQVLKEQRKLPKRAVVFADPWIFNANSGEDRWQSNLELVSRFMSEHEQGLTAQSRRWLSDARIYVSRSLNEIKDLLSWSVLKRSAELVQDQGFRERDRSLVVKETAVPSDRPAYRWDGSYVYAQDFLAPLTVEEITRVGAAYAAYTPVYSLGGWKVSFLAERAFGWLLDDMQKNGVEVTVLVPPYQATALSKLLARPGYSHIFPQFVAEVEKLLLGRSYVGFCNALDPAQSGCIETEFVDGMHMRRTCLEKVIARCFGKRPEWAELLSPKILAPPAVKPTVAYGT